MRPLLSFSLAVAVVLAAACSSSSSGPVGEVAPPPPDPTEPVTEDAGPPAVDAARRDASLPANGSKGCGSLSAIGKPGPVSGLTLPVGTPAKTRSYALSVPKGYDEYRGYPLVFVLHSGGRTGASARDYFLFESFAAEKAVFVYPDGEGGNWDLDTPAAKNKDIALFDALVAELEAKLCIDTTRIFATGSSMGAFLTNQLGCRRGNVLRAIAPHAGGGPWETGGKYDADGHLECAQKPVAAMVFIGLADTNVDPKDGEASIAHWSWADGCNLQATPAAVAPSPCVAYQGCKNPVVACKIPGVGHRIWNQGPKATWDFFASF